jgi:hypothetical protein
MQASESIHNLAEELLVFPALNSSPPQRVAQLQDDDAGGAVAAPPGRASPARRRRSQSPARGSGAASLTPEAARGIRAAFAELDTEHRGFLDKQTLQLYCLSLGLGPISVQEVRWACALQNACGADPHSPLQAEALHAELCGGDGPLDAELFTALVLSPPRPAQAHDAAVEFDAAFALLDADGDGSVSSLDLDDVLRRVRAKPAHRASLLAEGRLSRSELAALLAHGPPRRAAGHRVARA